MLRASALHTTGALPLPALPLALRRHRLPRFWLAITLGSVAFAVGAGYWWERQLPTRIEQAAKRGDLDACLTYSDQLAALSWLPGRSPQQQGRCRRAKASQLWQAKRWREALQLQQLLIASTAALPEDRQQLILWRDQLRRQAIARFQAGELAAALAMLAPLGEDHRSDGSSLGDDLRETWSRNRLQLERASRLARQARWWEALDALNRIDHPWWQQRSLGIRQRVQQGLNSLAGKDREHDSHGELPHTVPADKLDALVQRRIAAGRDEWQAFQEACRELGGKVVEAGPESACQR